MEVASPVDVLEMATASLHRDQTITHIEDAQADLKSSLNSTSQNSIRSESSHSNGMKNSIHIMNEQSISGKQDWHNRLCTVVARLCGHWSMAVVAICMNIGWIAAGPIFSFSTVWQLYENSISTMVAYLLVFILQNRKNEYMMETHQLLHQILLILQNRKTTQQTTTVSIELVPALILHDSEHNNGSSSFINIDAWFERAVVVCAKITGSHWTFIMTIMITILWMSFGPLAGWSDLWQLILNSAFAVVIFIIVFLLLHSEQIEMETLLRKLQQLMLNILHSRLELADNARLEANNVSRVCTPEDVITLSECYINLIADENNSENLMHEQYCTMKHDIRLSDPSEHQTIVTIPVPKPLMVRSRNIPSIFGQLSEKVTDITGSAYTFIFAILSIFAWLAGGPSMEWNENWWLIINTETCIVTGIILFPLQNTELRRRHMTTQHISRIAHILEGTEYHPESAKRLAQLHATTTMQHIEKFFEHIADRCSHFIGHPLTFMFIIFAVAGWGISGLWQPDDRWQLEINTAAMIFQQICLVLLENSMAQSQRCNDLLLDKALKISESCRRNSL